MKILALLLMAALLLPGVSEANGGATCEVLLNDEPQPVIMTAVNHQRVWTSRPMLAETPVVVAAIDGEIRVEATFPGTAMKTVTIRPLSLGVDATVNGDTVSFTLPDPADVTVEPDGNPEAALHLFLSPTDTDKPEADALGVIHLGPGEHEGIITPKDGETVYLDEGCVLRGAIHADGVTGVRIAGRGIIDGSSFDRWDDTLVPIDFANSREIEIEGITILDPSAWTLNLYHCEDVRVTGVNIVGARSNSDGITIQSCADVTVSDCFVRGWDDNLVVKGYDGDARDIAFVNCVLWTDLAQSCEIGYETRADVIERITFQDITVLHAFHKPVMSIHNSDNALVTDILFQNITIEDLQVGQGDGANFLFDLTTTKSQWSKSKTRGNIRGVMFDGITVLSGIEASVRIFSFGKDANIDDVVFRRLTLPDGLVNSLSDLKLNVNRHNGENITLEEN